MGVPSTLSFQSKLIAALVLVTVLLQGALFLVSKPVGQEPAVESAATAPATLSDSPPLPTDPQVTTPSASVLEQPLLPELREVIHTVARGQTLSTIFSQYGAPVRGAIAAERALREISSSAAALRVGDLITLRINDAQEVVFLERRLRDGTVVRIEGDSVQGYRSSSTKPVVHESERSISGVIRSNFVAAAREEGVPFEVIDDVVDLFGGRLEFRRELQVGDSFTIIYTERRLSDGTLLETGPIHAASISKSGAPLFAVRYLAKDSTEHFFDENGELLGNYFLRYPLKFTRISSSFSYARFHPVLQKNRPHNGVDFAAPTGTPVRAVADGTVEIAAYRGGAGKMIRIRHCDRYTTEYLHLHTIDGTVRPGGRVKRGQVIGGVGTTGLSTGPHLHFGMFDRGRYIDPMKAPLPVVQQRGVRIPADYLRLAVQNLQKHRESLQVANNQLISARG